MITAWPPEAWLACPTAVQRPTLLQAMADR